jgi:hypothetical protein
MFANGGTKRTTEMSAICRFLEKATSLSDRLAVAIMSTRPSTALRGRSFR